ncbi:MAG: alpha/beta fold hydrolase [Woeseiaceae bacterium]
MNKLYGDTSYGQVHARVLAADGETTAAPLLCLHPAPSSGLYFTTVMPKLNVGRQVIAPDYPGYGGSDPLAEAPTIPDYAAAMLELLDAMKLKDAVDVLGFHTGCLVGAEMALQNPGRIRRLLLCDVPYFDTAQRDGLKQKMAQPMPITSNLDSLTTPWDFNIASRIDTVPLPRAFELFAEHLRAGQNDYFGFSAAFSYDCESRFAQLDTDVVLLATQSGLHEPTVKAHSVLSGARFIDVPEVTSAVFEQGATAIATRINEALTS